MAEASFEDSMKAFAKMDTSDVVKMFAGICEVEIEDINADKVTETQQYFREVTGGGNE